MLMHRPQTPKPGFGSITLLQKFTPHFKILDPRLMSRGKINSKVKTILLQCCALCNVEVIRLIVTEGLNTLD